jgi:fructosamine-3-kinase
VLTKELLEQLRLQLAFDQPLSNITSIGGGSINECYSFRAGEEKFFLKVNSAEKFPGMFACEAKGLNLLAASCGLVIPRVIYTGTIEKDQILVLGFLEKKNEDATYFNELGRGLARLHKTTQKKFGLDHANYIGSLPQDNSPENSWNEFFICRRIEPLLRQAIDVGELPKNCRSSFENLFKKLDELIPIEKPALLHGDLWSGNKMNTNAGASMFDPAVYFGHREVDIAMTKLFGGFSPDFYSAYTTEFPLEKGWERRVEILNLYPLLVHTVLFGGSYANDVTGVIRRF